MKRALTLCLTVLALLAAAAWAAEDEEPEDSIRILAVIPEDPVVRGVQREFVIDVRADLRSAHDGRALVGFNTESPTGFKMVDARELAPGPQTFTFEVRAVPVDWQDRGEFAVTVNMGPKPDGPRWRPTASDQRVIEVVP